MMCNDVYSIFGAWVNSYMWLRFAICKAAISMNVWVAESMWGLLLRKSALSVISASLPWEVLSVCDEAACVTCTVLSNANLRERLRCRPTSTTSLYKRSMSGSMLLWGRVVEDIEYLQGPLKV